MRIQAAVTCEQCGHRMELERFITRPERVYLVCHNCEGIITTEITAADFNLARLQSRVAARAR